MGRLLLLVLAITVLVWLARRALRPPQGRGNDRAPGSVGELVPCAHCGVLVPRSEARVAAGETYCGEEHARRGPRRS